MKRRSSSSLFETITATDVAVEEDEKMNDFCQLTFFTLSVTQPKTNFFPELFSRMSCLLGWRDIRNMFVRKSSALSWWVNCVVGQFFKKKNILLKRRSKTNKYHTYGKENFSVGGGWWMRLNWIEWNFCHRLAFAPLLSNVLDSSTRFFSSYYFLKEWQQDLF